MDERPFSNIRNPRGSSKPSKLYIAFFSRLYYLGAPISNYGKVLIVATGFRIAV